MHSDGRKVSVKFANSATTERSDIYEEAGIGCTLAAATERHFYRCMLDKDHRILRRPRIFAIAVKCSATQGLAKRRCYVFVYSHIGVWVAAVLPDARSMLQGKEPKLARRRQVRCADHWPLERCQI
jgi:hypothetical protein